MSNPNKDRDRAIQYAHQIELTPPRAFLGAYLTAAWPSENHVDHCYIVWSAILCVMEGGRYYQHDLPIGSAVWSVVRGVLATHKKLTGGHLDVTLSRIATARCLAIMIPAVEDGYPFGQVVADYPELQLWAAQKAAMGIEGGEA